jgi:outer membrane lipoprotein-sorting protein
MKMSGTQKFSDQEIKIEQTMTMISDGEFSYTVTDDKGQKSAYKQKVDASMNEDPKTTIETMKEEYTLKLLPDEKVDGADCIVIEGTSKQKEGDPMVKQILYFRKDCGLNVKMVGRDASDKAVFTHEVSDVKLNTEIPADRFVFKKPDGVEMIDLTQEGEPAKQP